MESPAAGTSRTAWRLRSLSLLLMLPLTGAASAASGPRLADAGPVLGFVENRGQLEGPGSYCAFGGAGAVWFAPDGLTIVARAPALPAGPVETADRIAARVGGKPLAMGAAPPPCARTVRFAGAGASPRIEAGDPLPLRLNWLRGRDPARWLADVPVFATLRYRDVWPGVDLVFRAADGRLGVEAQVGPGGRAADVRFVVAGERAGALEVAGTVALGGAGPAPPAAPAPAYSPLVWSTYLGGTLGEYAGAVALGPGDRVVIAGQSRSPDFPVTNGAFDTFPAGGYDVFVAQLDAMGRRLLWCTYLGGGDDDLVYAVAYDAAGDVVLGGHTDSADFPVTAGAWDRTFGGGGDGFVARLDAQGQTLRASTLVGGAQHDLVADIAIDSAGRVLATGNTASTAFPVTAGGFDRTYGGGNGDGFLLRLAGDLASLHWSTFLGGLYNDYGEALAVDVDGTIVVAGNTGSPDFPVTTGAFDRTPNGGDDAFVTRFAPGGNALVWSTYIGGGNFDACTDFVLDLGGNALVAGTTYSPDFPTTPGAWDRTFNGGHDVFVSRVAASGATLLMSTLLGGSEGETAWALAVDPLFGAFVLGETGSADFPVTPGAFDCLYGGGGTDAFLARVGPSGQDLSWSTFLGGAAEDHGYALARSATGDLVAAGGTRSLDFPVTELTWDRSFGGLVEAFALRLMPPRAVAVPAAPPGAARLRPARPNPFNARVVVPFVLAGPGEISLTLHDVAGRRVRELAHGPRDAGEHRAVWDGCDDAGRPVASGVYRCRLQVGNSLQETRIVLAR